MLAPAAVWKGPYLPTARSVLALLGSRTTNFADVFAEPLASMVCTVQVPTCANRSGAVGIWYESLKVPAEEELLVCAVLPSGATHAIRRSLGAFVATAQAVSPRFHDDFGVVQSVANVLILSS